MKNEEEKMIRNLTSKEIEEFANRHGVKKIAVENFLSSMGTNLTDIIGNVALDAKLYNWNQETINAIMEGVWMAAGLEEGDMIVV